MKLTWFGGATVRIHIGGSIFVCNPAAIGGADPDELVSGADRVFALDGGLEQIDPASWQPGRAGSMLDEASLVAVHAIDGGAVVAAAGEPPLLLVKEALPRVGRWGRDAVVVVFGGNADALAATVLEALGPKLIAVAATEAVVDRAFAAIGGRLDGTGLVALEAGLALEV